MKMTFEDLVTDISICPFFVVFVVFSFLPVITFCSSLCLLLQGVGLKLEGGVRWDLRVQSYHVFLFDCFIEIHCRLFLNIFFMHSVPSDQPVVCHSVVRLDGGRPSLKATVKPSHWLLLSEAFGCSHSSSVRVMKSISS